MAFFSRLRKGLMRKDNYGKLETWLEQREDILKDTDQRMFEMEHWLGHMCPKLHPIRLKVEEIRMAASPTPQTGQNELAKYKRCVATMKKEADQLKKQEMELFRSCQKLFSNQFSHMSTWMMSSGGLENGRTAKMWEATRSNAQWCKMFVQGERQNEELDKWRRLAWLNYLFKSSLDRAGHHMDLSAVENFLGKALTEP